MTNRVEHDALGTVLVPETALYGPQTARSRLNFPITEDHFAPAVIRALLAVKKAAAQVNFRHGRLGRKQAEAIQAACAALRNNYPQYAAQFPLSIWQTGSGTQTNMNVNEVIARLAQVQFGMTLNPNDDVNCSQSSNDVFPTAMHLAALGELDALLYQLIDWQETLDYLIATQGAEIRLGRTHLQDATPMTFGQQLSGWRGIISASQTELQAVAKTLTVLAIGGTAVGTGLNAPAKFGAEVAELLRQDYHYTLTSQPVKTLGLSSHHQLVALQNALSNLGTGLMKIANDIRWLASGPRAGLGELVIPANEPGSSIMPGKVNPTQSEALCMIVCRVLGHTTTVQMAASQGNFELNAYKPVIIDSVLDAMRLLTKGMQAFRNKCLAGVRLNVATTRFNVAQSLMNVTALTPRIGYSQAAKIAQYAQANDLSLVAAGVALGVASQSQLEEWLNPAKMI
ncbi:class II fumarate hydratase [Lacticaseibacillus daqingensis]|uniref:class II fumarate hydratase n=1 Tax=Lacticaseibacillus daqingensis TaxID=2486014 RepID=UPI000F79C70F|nr:class II fumarate hydratase [Lacticaseibacillus daqingensis]